MKKVSFKFVVSALAASMMITATAVSASAISYGGGVAPVTPTPATTTAAATTTAPAAVDAAADDAGTVVATGVVTEEVLVSAVADAVKAGATEVTVKVAEDATTGGVTVQEAAIADIAKSGVAVTFDVKPVSGTAYSVTIDPSTITDASSINLGMAILTGPDIATAAAAFDIPVDSAVNAVMIAPMAQGEFGMELTITLPASAFGTIDTDSAMLFYLADDGSVTDVSDQLVFDADGNGSITISHASAYVISDIDLVAAAEDLYADLSDDDEDEDDAAVDASIDEDDDKADDEPVIISGAEEDSNPGTGVGLALGAVAVSAAAVVLAKKRK
jgi:hypothetical protein